jgi:hypothetical protein
MYISTGLLQKLLGLKSVFCYQKKKGILSNKYFDKMCILIAKRQDITKKYHKTASRSSEEG